MAMAESYKQIVCMKLLKQDDDFFTCSQNEDSKCGCQSSISSPSVDLILSEPQKDKRNEHINRIKDNVKSGTLALVTGAGISKPCGMPLWNGLISQMIGYGIQYDLIKDKILKGDEAHYIFKDLTQQLIKKDLSILGSVNPLELAEYIAQSFEDLENDDVKHRQIPDAFMKTIIRRIVENSVSPIELLKKEMKSSTNMDLALKHDFDEKDIKSFFEKVNLSDIASLNTMFAVSYLLYYENGIRQVMTYNFDPLVQECLLDLYKLDKSKIVTHSEKFCDDVSCLDGDMREFYHIHGFVSGKRHVEHDCPRIFPPDSKHIILSEDSYYRVEREEIYSWSSCIQSYFLNKYDCLFVGFSAEDYNFKRIIHQIKSEDVKTDRKPYNQRNHYLIMNIEDWVRSIYEDVCRSMFKCSKKITCDMLKEISEKTIILIQKALEYRENYWKRFNIYPVWVTINEIPKLLISLIN